MTETVPVPSVKDDLNAVLNIVVNFATEELSKRGEFYPFGAVITQDGRQAFTSADPEQAGEHPQSQAILDVLYAGAKAMADDLRAVAFCCDITYEGGDAVRAEAEHREDACILVLPYVRDAAGQVTTGEPVMYANPGHVWDRS